MNKFYILLLIGIFVFIGCGIQDQPENFTAKYPPVVPPGGAPLPTYSVETMQTNIEARLQTIGITYADLGLSDGWPTVNSSVTDLEAASDINGYFHNFTGLLWDFDSERLIIPLPANHSVARQRESIIGNILLDGLLWKGRTVEPDLKFAISNGGGLRGDRGPSMVEVGTEYISMSHIAGWLFWGNQTSIASVSLEKIVDIFEMSYTNLPGQSGSFFHVSGLIIDLDITQLPGDRVQRIWWWDDETEEKELFFDNPNFVGGWSADSTVKMMSSDYVINVQLGLSGSQYDGALEQTEALSAGEYLTYLEEEGVTELYTGFGYNDTNPFRIMMTRFPGVTIPPNFVGGYAPENITVHIDYAERDYPSEYYTIKVEYFTTQPYISIQCDTPEFYNMIDIESTYGDTTGSMVIKPKSSFSFDTSHLGIYEYKVIVASATDNPLIRTQQFKVIEDTDVISILASIPDTFTSVYYQIPKDDTELVNNPNNFDTAVLKGDTVFVVENTNHEFEFIRYTIETKDISGENYYYYIVSVKTQQDIKSISVFDTTNFKVTVNDTYFYLVEGYNTNIQNVLFDLNASFGNLFDSGVQDLSANNRDNGWLKFQKNLLVYNSTGLLINFKTGNCTESLIYDTHVVNPGSTNPGAYLYTLTNKGDGNSLAKKIWIADKKATEIVWEETVYGVVGDNSSISATGGLTDTITVITETGTFVYITNNRSKHEPRAN